MVALLLAVLLSGASDFTVAVFVAKSCGPAFTTIETVAPAPALIDPRLHVTVVVPEHEPWLALDETNVTCGGSVSVRMTLGATAGPLFVT